VWADGFGFEGVVVFAEVLVFSLGAILMERDMVSRLMGEGVLLWREEELWL